MSVNTKSPMHPSLQFLILSTITVGCMLLGAIIGMGFITVLYGANALTEAVTFNSAAPHFANTIWIFQILSTTIPLFLAPVIFARLIVSEPREYLKSTKVYPAVLFLLVFAIMMFSSPLIDFLGTINQKMALPGFLKSVEQWMREKEDLAAKQTQVLLQMKTIGSMLFNVLEIGLLTAIAEEFLFRGCIQTIFTRWTNSIHWGIWITAILFSAFHMQFFGFLPRFMLGILFGYFVAYSGSIWTSVMAHFINNGTAVLVTYLYQHSTIKSDPDNIHYNYIIHIFSLIFTVLLFFVYQYCVKQKNCQDINGKELG